MNLRNLGKILRKQFSSATPLKQLNRILFNFVVIKDIMCRCAYLQQILIQFFFRGAPFEFRKLI